jgi:hypothetical protein
MTDKRMPDTSGGAGSQLTLRVGTVEIRLHADPLEKIVRTTPLDAIASSDDSVLSMGGGVSGVIVKLAGTKIRDEVAADIPFPVGSLAITSGGRLPIPDASVRQAFARELAAPSLEEMTADPLLEEIGRGGMAVVFLSWDLILRRTVAIKVLKPELSGSDVSSRPKPDRTISEGQLQVQARAVSTGRTARLQVRGEVRGGDKTARPPGAASVDPKSRRAASMRFLRPGGS